MADLQFHTLTEPDATYPAGRLRRFDGQLFVPRTGTEAPPPDPEPETPAGARAFSPDSFWYKPIPADAPLHPNGRNIVAYMDADRRAHYGGDVNLNTTAYACPVYLVDANTPRENVGFVDYQGKGGNGGYYEDLLMQSWRNVPIPTYARPADGTDQEMACLDLSTGEYWEFWVCEYFEGGKAPGGIYYANQQTSHRFYACWGGKMTNTKLNQGIFPHPFGTTATGLPFIGGQISIEEGKAAAAGDLNAIKHALGVAPVGVRAGGQSWPANRNDGWINDANAPYEGQRLRLPLSYDVANMPGTNLQRAIVRAVQVYGLVVWDKAGSMSLRGENPKPLTLKGQADPWPAIFAGSPSYKAGVTIPWDQLVALPFDYGKPTT